MGEVYNIYCDESCHLERDRERFMVLGATWCAAERAKEIADRLREFKVNHHLAKQSEWADPNATPFETKWTKVSNAQVAYYLDVVDYFFDDDDLHFRGVVVDKSQLRHEAHGQTHDEHYYKMLFVLLEPIINPREHYNIYLDLKDRFSYERGIRLLEYLRTARHDYAHEMIRRVQPIRSHESEIMQVADVLIGAIAYCNRVAGQCLPKPGEPLNAAKMELVRRIQRRSGKSLQHTTWLLESKLNLLVWTPKGEGL